MAMKWLTATGERVSIKKMETRHLFYTLRLIWNNQHGKTHRWNRGPIRPFTDPQYTEGYLKDVNYQMHKELLSRKLPAWMVKALEDLKVLKLELLLECP
ncbi:hypothetical protein PYDG_00050 [Pseudoalteromonas phage pYD6-A]|uniref:Uncharacterized protein n=1 Tax=Pseudoalteromonas phage pYD6-A TaxID=754052 RepID=M4SRZ7_9CAUD|nr:hypothetical protein PYDG_00050 [Pseudoalteromonas phage pYD6-A]AGH57581.1 hypothetical protein PYDG_00050 [Pseudoalteromonas phage pYD6-A]